MEKEIIKELINNSSLLECHKLEIIDWLEKLIEKASMYDGLCK